MLKVNGVMKQLGKCPFCRKQATWCDDDKSNPHECHHIECKTCDALFDMCATEHPDIEDLTVLKELCAKKFNKRAN